MYLANLVRLYIFFRNVSRKKTLDFSDESASSQMSIYCSKKDKITKYKKVRIRVCSSVNIKRRFGQ